MTYGAPSGPLTIPVRSIGSPPSAGVNVNSGVDRDRDDPVQPVEAGHDLLLERVDRPPALTFAALGRVELLVGLGQELLGLLRVVRDQVDARAR